MIRPMRATDLPGADALRQLAGWNQTLDDWRSLLSLEPAGCFVALQHERVVGTVTTTIYGGVIAWIGMMLVHPGHRRRGIGMQLMQTALNHLRGQSIDCIRLDATPAGAPLYAKLGFVPEWTFTRHEGAPLKQQPKCVRSAIETDWPMIEGIDREAFGISRAAVLRAFAQNARAVMVWPPEGPIAGFGMLRPGARFEYLGPVVCKSADGAIALVGSLATTAVDRHIFWDVPDENPIATTIAARLSFTGVRALTRMRLGPLSIPTNPGAHLAIADPSVG